MNHERAPINPGRTLAAFGLLILSACGGASDSHESQDTHSLRAAVEIATTISGMPIDMNPDAAPTSPLCSPDSLKREIDKMNEIHEASLLAAVCARNS